MACLSLRVLGELQVLQDDVPVQAFESDKTRALLAYLAVEADHSHGREKLIGLLWPDYPEEAARHNLRQALYNLRLALGDHTAKPPYLLITRDAIQFNRESDYSLDLDQFNAHFSAWEKNQGREGVPLDSPLSSLEEMVDLYQGEFMQQFYLEDSEAFEEWILVQREASHRRVMNALTTLANEYELHGDLQNTRRCALRQLELDPWREEAHGQMMRVLALKGERSAALAQYEHCRRILAEELGVEPSPQTRELYEQIRAGTLKPRVEPPTQAPAAPLQNLPISLTSFIGRKQELTDLARLIGDPECRCLTLVGPGGIGKTRLALQAAAQHQNEFVQGIAVILLASVGTVDAVIPAIASAINLAFYGPIDPKVQLLNYLREKQMLLVLDNVEHLLVEGAQPGTIADLLIEMLQQAAQVKLLVTSREALNLQEEWLFEVQGLSFPREEETGEFDEYSAVALFLQRARRTRPGFEMNAEVKTGVVRLCRLVEGMPLAIELAAAWVRILSPTEIASEVEHNLDFLNAQMRDLPERHRSMRAVFNHSWQMLSAVEKQVLGRLSVFRGGFQRQAAEQVAEATLSVLSTLVTKSLIRRSGAGRYDLHELIRQFAAEQFAGHPEEQAATQARHGSYYMMFFSQAGERFRSSAQREALAELTAEMGNFRAAWDWAVTHDKFALIEQTMHLFVWFYDTHGWFQEGLDTLGRVVDALETSHEHSPPDRTNQVALGHILTARSWLAYRLAHYDQAQAMLERSLKILHPLNEPRVMVEAITFLGQVMEVTGNYARALELYSQGLEIGTAIGDRWQTALCLTLLNGLLAITDAMVKPENTHERLQSAVADWRTIGDPRFTAFGLRILSQSALRLGRYAEARTALEESAALNSSVGDRWGLGSAYRGLGVVAQAQGEHHQALNMFHKSLDTFTELGGRWWVARVLAEMGQSDFVLGNNAEAERVWRESIRIAIETRATPVALEALAGFASLQAKRGNMEHALELQLMVSNHPASFEATKDRVAHLRAELEAQLTSQQVEAAQERAQAKSFEAVVSELLKQDNLT